MIKLNNLEKYFNKNQKNEIHVINDINLSLPEKGLVVLLGPSGSGKTTLLNVLGGLDKVQKGSIEFDQNLINRYSSRVWDEIRNKHVGYIFQNYNLLNNLTVYDNIALTLNMVGVVDKAEIDKRIDYILENIGMGNYRKRRANQLSGGQQQRVAIARALAKNPKVIIADEPTGNLDSKNTIEIMNIIKKISITKLVVLVTHEQELADFYADRVIILEDGKIISDILNASSEDLDMQHDTDIYLKDLNKLTDEQSDVSHLKIYSDEDLAAKFDIKLIVKNKTLYLDVSSLDYKKVKLINSESEVKVFDKHFEKVKRETFEDSSFNLEAISSEELTVSNKSVISVKESLNLAYKRLVGTSRLGKLFYFGFVGAAALIAVAIALLSNVYYFNPASFLTAHENTVVIDYDNFTYAKINEFEENSSIDYASLITSNTTLTFDLPLVYQAWENETSFSAYPVQSNVINSNDIIRGRNVEAYDEIVIDKIMADNILLDYSFLYLGINTYEALMNTKIICKITGSGDDYEYIITIVGISDTKSPVFYAKEETIYMLKTRVAVYEVFEEDVTISVGALPIVKNKAILFDDPLNTIPYNLRGNVLLGLSYGTTGLYTSTEDSIPKVMIPLELMKEAYFTAEYTTRGKEMHFQSNDVEATIDYFTSQEIDSSSLYDLQLADFRLNRLNDNLGILIFTLVTLGASSISFYFIIRSSLISRIYDVSVYRALGVTKLDILKMFVTEIILITSITSLLGFLGTSYLLYKIQMAAGGLLEVFHFSVLSIIGGIVLIYLINILSGILPVSNLLRKTPAEILSKYDF